MREVRAAFEAIEAGVGRRRQGRDPRGAAARARRRGRPARSSRCSSGELRIGLREGLLEAAIARAFDRPLDAVKRAGMLTGDVGRTARPRPRGPPGRRGDGPVPPAQVHARVARRGRGRDRRPPRARRSGWRTSTTGSAPSCTARATRCGSTRATSTTSAASSPRSSRAPADLPWAGILDGELLAWRTGWCCRSSSSRRGSAARTRRPRSSPSPRHLRRLGRAGPGPRRGRRRGAAARAPARRAPPAPGGPGPAARRRWRPLRPEPPRDRRLGGRPRGGVRRGAGAPQRGPHGQGSPERRTRPAAGASAG